MNIIETLTQEIDSFIARHGMTDTGLGMAAIKDGKIVHRIRSGANVTVRTIDRLREFMAERDAE